MSQLTEMSEEKIKEYMSTISLEEWESTVVATYDMYVSMRLFPGFKKPIASKGTALSVPISQFRKIYTMVYAVLDSKKKIFQVVSAPKEKMKERVKVSVPDVFEDGLLVKGYVDSYYDDRVSDLKIILSPLDKRTHLFFPGDGAGVGFAAATELGFEKITSFDTSGEMCNIAMLKGNTVTRADDMDVPDGAIVIVSHLIDYVPNVVHKYIKYPLIVYEQYASYNGSSLLKKTRLTYGYHVASNIPGYDPVGVITLSSRKAPSTIPIHESVVDGWDSFLFCEKGSLKYLTYLLWLDPQRTKHYAYVGADSSDIATAYGIHSNRDDNPCMIFANSITFPDMVRPKDVVFNVAIGRLMSVNYFEEIFPHMSPMTTDALVRIGFNMHRDYPGVNVVRNLNYSIYSDNVSFVVGIPYLLKGNIVTLAAPSGVLVKGKLNVREYDGYNIVRFSTAGFVSYDCDIVHGVTGADACHRHLKKIVSVGNAHRSKMYARFAAPMLSVLPQVFYYSDLNSICARVCMKGYRHVRRCLDLAFLNGIAKKSGDIVYNSSSKLVPMPKPMAELQCFADVAGKSLDDYMLSVFGGISLSTVPSDNHDWLYGVGGRDGDRYVIIDMTKYVERVPGTPLQLLSGMMPFDRAKSPMDLVILKNDVHQWPLKFYGRALYG